MEVIQAPASPVEEPFKQPLALSHKFIHSKNKRKTRMQLLERSTRVKHSLCLDGVTTLVCITV